MPTRPSSASCPNCRAVFRRQLARCPIDGAPLHPIPTDPLLGSVLAGRYRIDSVAGDTSSSRIYSAIDRRGERRVAVRMLFGEYASVPRRCLSFAREVRIAGLFDHPNVLSVLDSGYTDTGLPFLVTEVIEARTLEAVIREEAPFGSRRVTSIADQLCAALEHIHQAGVIHRNLTAASVLLEGRPAGEAVRVTDFRHALRPEWAEDTQFLEPLGRIVGRAPYAAPEQALRRGLDHRADLFSLGVLIYRMACGALPFDGEPVVVAIQTGFDAPPAMRERVPGFVGDAALEALAMRLMAKRPEDRFSSAAAVKEALSELRP